VINVKTSYSALDKKTFCFDTTLTIADAAKTTRQLVDKRELRSLRFITAPTDAKRCDQYAKFLNDTVEMRVRRAFATTFTKVQMLISKEDN